MKKIASLITVVGLTVGLAACDDDDPKLNPLSSETSTTTKKVTSTATVSPSNTADRQQLREQAEKEEAGIAPLGDASVAAKEQRPQSVGAVVTDVRVGHHDGFDRIVFDIEGSDAPGWYVDYTDTPAQMGSGHALEYNGKVALIINIDGVSYPFETTIESADLSKIGGAGHIKEVREHGIYEGRQMFVAGLDSRRPYSVQLLQNPTRVVVDIVDN
ncbi:AMIN-like domain-containing (lipo)protein [Corynebacterium pseudopelargi]|uniref:AMIN-like domain-containing protein n=1 Tax=Corynebacterium pseudopelargi TaxID=2080757 RepID=A0A3G6IVV5_9CORY|nr:hypothetical protein [Corynebacterium pseudopelargi]AZA09909.1 hypothetical protein CPPEL_09030 [Corynebacterium pseudopelargi]